MCDAPDADPGWLGRLPGCKTKQELNMKRLFEYLMMTAVLAGLAASCSKDGYESPSVQEGTKVLVSFGIAEQESTKVTNVSASSETAITGGVLYIFNGDELVDQVTMTGSRASVELDPGTYTAAAVVNVTSPSQPSSLTNLRTKLTYLYYNSSGKFEMYGEKSFTVARTGSVPQTVLVSRQVAKIGIEKITVASDVTPVITGRGFTVKRIYLTNVFRVSRYYDAYNPVVTTTQWYNRMGQSTSPADALILDSGINASIATGSSYTTKHYFYTYPNSTTAASDRRTGTWSVRCTRLVVEAEVGTQTYYYTVTVPAIERNKTYIIKEMIIKKLGSTDPEQEIPGAADVEFESDVQGWGSQYNITETT